MVMKLRNKSKTPPALNPKGEEAETISFVVEE